MSLTDFSKGLKNIIFSLFFIKKWHFRTFSKIFDNTDVLEAFFKNQKIQCRYLIDIKIKKSKKNLKKDIRNLAPLLIRKKIGCKFRSFPRCPRPPTFTSGLTVPTSDICHSRYKIQGTRYRGISNVRTPGKTGLGLVIACRD